MGVATAVAIFGGLCLAFGVETAFTWALWVALAGAGLIALALVLAVMAAFLVLK